MRSYVSTETRDRHRPADPRPADLTRHAAASTAAARAYARRTATPAQRGTSITGAACSARRWQRGYVRAVIATDFAACLLAAAVAYLIRFDPGVPTADSQAHLLLSLAVPPSGQC